MPTVDIPIPAPGTYAPLHPELAGALEDIRRAVPGLRQAGITKLRLQMTSGVVELEMRPLDLPIPKPSGNELSMNPLDDPTLYPGGFVPRLPSLEEFDDEQ